MNILLKINQMKKSILILLIAGMFMPKQATAQNNDGVAAAAAGLLAIGGAIAAIEQIKENLEQVAVEQVLTAYPYLVNFELKTGSLKGTKLKGLIIR
jgi:hypothetical protein